MRKELGIGALLVVLCGVLAALNPQFIELQNLQNLSLLIGLFGIFSIGMGIIIITGGIDLSVGSVFALQGVLLSIMLREWHWPWLVAAVASIGSVMVLGLAHAFFITKVRLQPFIVTLCGLLIYRGLARSIAHDETKGFGTESWGPLRWLAKGYIGPMPVAFILLLVIAAIMWVVLHRSVYGRYLYAVGRNEEAARYSGINTDRIIGSVYVLSMLLAGISGILFALWVNSISPSNHGSFYELYGIAAAVLGGCSLRGGEGSIIGILLGTALLQVLQNLVNLLGIPSSYNFAVMGGVILLGVTVDQLLGNRRRSRKSAVVETGTPPPSGFEVIPATTNSSSA
jgi:ribose transport system permease protein